MEFYLHIFCSKRSSFVDLLDPEGVSLFLMLLNLNVLRTPPASSPVNVVELLDVNFIGKAVEVKIVVSSAKRE